MFSEEEFSLYYKKNIKPEIDEFEQYRKLILSEYKRKKLLLVVLVVTLLAIIFYFYPNFIKNSFHGFNVYYSDFEDHYQLITMITFSIIIVIYYVLSKIKESNNEFIRNIKIHLYSRILGFYPKLKYKPFCGLSVSEIKETHLFPEFDLCKAEDYIEGEYKTIAIKLAEIELIKIIPIEVRINNRRFIKKKEKSFFKGLFIKTSINKKLSSITYVIPNKLLKVFNGLPNELKRIKLESEVFEKIFDVYGDNQVESRYLLTPSFMERLIELNNKSPICCCFIDNQMYIALNLDKEFLPSLGMKKVIDYHQVKQVIKQLDIIFDTIDILKLDMNIGL